MEVRDNFTLIHISGKKKKYAYFQLEQFITLLPRFSHKHSETGKLGNSFILNMSNIRSYIARETSNNNAAPQRRCIALSRVWRKYDERNFGGEP